MNMQHYARLLQRLGIRSIPLVPRNVTRFMDEFHAYNHAGMLVNGDSQSAKTASMATLIEEDIRQGRGTTVVDPHDQLVTRLENFCLTSPDVDMDDVYIIRIADNLNAALNVLYCDDPDQLAAVVSNAHEIAKASYGEATVTETRPNVDYWMQLAIEACALMRFPLVMAPIFLDPMHDLHEQLVNLIPDRTVSGRLWQIRAMPVAEQINTVGPALKRLDAMFKNTLMRDLCSILDGMDPREIILGQKVLLISLKLGRAADGRQVMRPNDRQYLACGWVSRLLQSTFGIEDENRVEHTIWLDELPLYECIHPMLEQGMRECAKYKLKFVGAGQGVFPYEATKDSPLLNSFVTNTHFQLYFRSQGELDSKFFSWIPFAHGYHPNALKHIETHRQQVIERQDTINLRNRAYNWHNGEVSGSQQGTGFRQGESENEDQSLQHGNAIANAKGDATAQGTGQVQSQHDGVATPEPSPAVLVPTATTTKGSAAADSIQHTKTKTNTVTRTNNVTRGNRRGRGRNRQVDRNRSSNRSRNRQRGSAVSIVQALVARYGFDVVRNIQFLDAHEQQMLYQQALVISPTGHCLSTVAGKGTCHLIFPMPRNDAPIAAYLAELRDAFHLQLATRPIYVNPLTVNGQYDRLLRQIREELPSLTHRQQQHGAFTINPFQLQIEAPRDLSRDDDDESPLPQDDFAKPEDCPFGI